MPTGHPKSGLRKDFQGNISAYKTIYRNNHYRSGGLSFDLFMELCVQPCYYCGEYPNLVNPYGATYDQCKNKMQGNLSYPAWYLSHVVANGIDKVIPSLGYCATNIVPCCQTCNFMKHLKKQQFFLDHIQKIYLHGQSKKFQNQIPPDLCLR